MAMHEAGSAGMGQSRAKATTWLTFGERGLRRTSAWLNLFFLTLGGLGAVWDREWHAYVGRDQFFTPPHTLIYSCVAGCGLIALTLVLIETARYRRKAEGADDSSMVQVFRFFHAPLGFVVTGFGALLAMTAAPLDNYWHEIYGIDIAMWAPFHMMGITGGLIGILGMVYVFASEAAIDREAGQKRRRFLGLTALDWGTLLVISSLMNFTLTGFLQFPIVYLGPLRISTYPLPLIASGAFSFIAAIRMTRRPGVATLLTLLLFLQTILVELFVPWAIRVGVAQQGLDYRIVGLIPYFRLDYAILPVVFLISALAVDAIAWWQLRKGGKLLLSGWRAGVLGAVIMPPIVILAPIVLQAYSPYAPIFLPQPGLTVPLTLSIEAFIGSALAMLIMGAGSGLIGADFGDIWRWNTR